MHVFIIAYLANERLCLITHYCSLVHMHWEFRKTNRQFHPLITGRLVSHFLLLENEVLKTHHLVQSFNHTRID